MTEIVQIGHHLMAIYENIDDEINKAFEFLSEGLSRNEAVMILTEDAGKDKLIKRIEENESALGGNLEELEKRWNVTIESTSSWYFPDGADLNPDRIIATFTAMVDLAVYNGKKAIRIFGDMSAFFESGLTLDLLYYESKLGKNFDLPLIGVCAFLAENINSLNPKQFEELQEYHNAVWK
jgi:hypothetical protein